MKILIRTLVIGILFASNPSFGKSVNLFVNPIGLAAAPVTLRAGMEFKLLDRFTIGPMAMAYYDSGIVNWGIVSNFYLSARALSEDGWLLNLELEKNSVPSVNTRVHFGYAWFSKMGLNATMGLGIQSTISRTSVSPSSLSAIINLGYAFY